MSVNDLRHSLLCPVESCVGDYIQLTDVAEVASHGECLPTTANNVIAERALHNFALVVNCEALLAEDGSNLTHDVWLVLPIVLDEHGCDVGSAGDVMGGEWREAITKSHVHFTYTTHGIYLHLEK